MTARVPRFPAAGALRIAADPTKLYYPSGMPGRNRFDDPRPNTQQPFAVRYAANTIRGCLLELLDWLRPNDQANDLEDAVDVDAEDSAPMDDRDQTAQAAFADFVAGRRVGRLRGKSPLGVVSIDSADTQAELDREPAVRALLDNPEGQATMGARTPHLDGAAVRIGGDFGRALTQACSLAIHDRRPRLDAIHYRSRHDDHENCWAIYDHVELIITSAPLSPARRTHRSAVQDVVALWHLALPAEWPAP